MKTHFIAAAASLLLAAPVLASDNSFALTGDVVVDGCAVSSGTVLPLVNSTVSDDVRSTDGNCIAIPAGTKVIESASGTARIEFPDGRVLAMSNH